MTLRSTTVPTSEPSASTAAERAAKPPSLQLPADWLFRLLVGGVLAFLVYDKVRGGRPEVLPKADRPEAAVVALGETYGRSLLKAAASTLSSGSTGSWTSAVEAKAGNRKAFDAGIQTALDPVAAEMARRFGEATTAPMEPAKAAALRKFWRDLAAGIERAGKK